METFCQIWIVLCGVPAIWLLGRLEHWRRWGFVVGILAQPAWFYTSIINEQWGIFMLASWYTYSWGQGIWNYFFKNNPSLAPLR